MVDAAQTVPHMKVDVKDMDCDFMAFSSHKMLGPSGIGVLYGKEEILEETTPAIVGSDMIRSVSFDSVDWNELPWKFESGTPNIEGAIGFGAAISYLNRIGVENIANHEAEILKYAFRRLEEVKGIRTYGPGMKDLDRKVGLISFNLSGAHPHDVASILDTEGVAIRAGHHCAMPLVQGVLGETAVSRMSFYLYNKQEEVDKLIDAMDKVRRVLRLDKKH